MNKLRVVLGYLIRKSDPYYEYGLERERMKPQVVRMKPWSGSYEEPKSLRKFKEEHTTTYADHEFDSIQTYGYVGHSAINKTLRGTELGEDDYEIGAGQRATESDIEAHIDSLDSGMRRSPTKSPVVVWRGLYVHFDGKNSFHPLEEKIAELGAVTSGYSTRGYPKRVDYQKALGLKGFTFTEPSFVSTSFNVKTAQGFTDRWTTPFVCEIKVPAGTQAIYMPGAHKVVTESGLEGIKDAEPVHNEVELLLDRGLKFRVTNVTLTSLIKGRTGFIVHLDIVK